MEADYLLGSRNVNEERDERVIIDRSLKTSKQCVKAARAANTVLGMITERLLCPRPP